MSYCYRHSKTGALDIVGLTEVKQIQKDKGCVLFSLRHGSQGSGPHRSTEENGGCLWRRRRGGEKLGDSEKSWLGGGVTLGSYHTADNDS